MSSLLNIFNIDDLNFIIINYIETFKDFKNIRLVNKSFFKSCMNIWKKYKGSENISYPRSTMINISNCHICNKFITEKKRIQLPVDYFCHPIPIYIICENWKCVHDCITNLFINAWNDNRLFLRNNFFPKKSLIPRSNNQITIANLDYNYILIDSTGKFLIRSTWFEKGIELTKCIEIKHINNKKPVISSWYKNYKKFKLTDIYDKIDYYEKKIKNFDKN